MITRPNTQLGMSAGTIDARTGRTSPTGRLVAALFVSLLALPAAVHGETKTVLYSYDFSGNTNDMGGQTLNGVTWWGGQVGGVPAEINADGSFSGGANGQVFMQTGWILTPGYVYDFKVTINLTSASQYVGLGISRNFGLWNLFNSTNGVCYIATGETFGAGVYNPGLASGNGTYKIRVDATAADWTATFFKDDVQQGVTRTWNGQAPFGPDNAPDGYAQIGLGVYGDGGPIAGTFSNLELSAVAGPEAVTVSSYLVPVGNAFSTNGTVVTAWGGNPILAGNLGQSATVTQLAGEILDGGLVANLNDGLMVSSNIYTEPQPEYGFPSGGYVIDQTANVARCSEGSQIKVMLDGTYALGKIDVFTAAFRGWDGQKWEVFTSADGGQTWSEAPLASVDYASSEAGQYNSRRVTVQHRDPGAALATGVNALRFDIANPDPGNPSGLSEIAVYGVVAPSGLSYTPSSQTGTVGTPITGMNPSVTGTVSTYSISPALPSGLSIDTDAGIISGTPLAAAAPTTYTVTASNAGGSTTANVTIGVQSAYAAWAQGAPLDPANQLRYAIGGASGPTATNGVASVSVVNSNLLSIVAIVRTNDPSLAVDGQSVLNLSSGTWITNDVTVNPSVDQAGVPSGTQRQIFSTPRATNDTRKFLRLRTTLGP